MKTLRLILNEFIEIRKALQTIASSLECHLDNEYANKPTLIDNQKLLSISAKLDGEIIFESTRVIY